MSSVATTPEPGADLVPAASGGQIDQTPASVAAAYLSRLVTGRKLRLGARTSPMAVAQAEHVAGLLSSVVPGLDVTISGITTTADQWAGDLAALGGKGAFVKEIDRALLMGEIDAAVHCMKDVPGDVPLPPGVVFAAYLPREDIRDCLVFPATSPLTALAEIAAFMRHTPGVHRRAGECGLPDRPAQSAHGRERAVGPRCDAGSSAVFLS